jgi:hypothetical protein
MEYLLETFPDTFLLDFDNTDLNRLYCVFSFNKSCFLNYQYDAIIENHQKNQTGNLREKIITEVLTHYGISHFFIKNFNDQHELIFSYLLSSNDNELNWFTDVVSGKNLVYSSNLPFKLTKKLAHKFNTVKTSWKTEAMNEGYAAFEDWDTSINKYSITKGLIWSALVYETKNVAFANEVMNNIRSTANVAFWLEIMPQLYRNGLRHNDNLNEIMDYINYAVFTMNQPINFKRKKIQNLIHDSDEWHLQMQAMRHSNRGISLIKLPKSTIKKFVIKIEDELYIIKQLKTNHELYLEGNELSHCVASYLHNCLEDGSFIFSLRQINADNIEKRLVTIEVLNHEIFQKSGKAIRQCSPLEENIIAEWAKNNGLTIK